MTGGTKIAIGALATALLAWGAHAALGPAFIDGLEAQANARLADAGLDGAGVTLDREPLSRHAALTGELDDARKSEAARLVANISGIGNVSWPGAEPVRTAANAGDGEAGDTDGNGEANAELDPETAAKVNECQDGVNEAIEGKKINFRSGSAWLSAESRRIIDEVAEALKPCSGLSVAVGGHTDNSGDARVNKTLSQERADRVAAALVERGVAENLVSATGFGAEQPLSGGDAAANRRIEFKVGAGDTAAEGDG